MAKIVYDEAKLNEEDEPYALWSKIADKPTKKGMTLRKEVQNVLMKRSLGKLANAEGLTSAMDGTDYLQVYVHDFEDWDGESALPTTFTPLTINDVDVTEIIVYDTVGQPAILDVSDDEWEPDYPNAPAIFRPSLLHCVVFLSDSSWFPFAFVSYFLLNNFPFPSESKHELTLCAGMFFH